MKQFVTTQHAIRLAAVGVLLGLGLVMTGCQARGGGSLLAGEAVNAVFEATYAGDATFGFTFRCEVEDGRAVVRGEVEYYDHGASSFLFASGATLDFPSIAIHGEVDPVLTEYAQCEDLGEGTLPVAEFKGRYWPQTSDSDLLVEEQGTFTVQVFDGGEPGVSANDHFSIALAGLPYGGYARAGNIVNGNIKVDS